MAQATCDHAVGIRGFEAGGEARDSRAFVCPAVRPPARLQPRDLPPGALARGMSTATGTCTTSSGGRNTLTPSAGNFSIQLRLLLLQGARPS